MVSTASKAHITLLVFMFCILINHARAERVRAVDYDYTNGPNGPAHWGDLSRGWALCKTGQEQSPIDINTSYVEIAQDAQLLQTNYKHSNAVLTIDKHGLQVSWPKEDEGSLTLDGTVYTVLQFHFHHPSEHTIDGVGFPLEMHVVHTSSDKNKTAVVGLLYHIGNEEDTFLTEVVTTRIASMLENNRTVEDVGLVSLIYQEFTKDYYRYEGSLTTPPCTEGVTWTMMTKTFSISLSQLNTIKQAVPDPNSRPLQLINGRSMFLYQPSSLHLRYIENHLGF